MRIVNVAYRSFPEHNDPIKWIDGFRLHYGIWETIATRQEVIFLESIDYTGAIERRGVKYLFRKRTNTESRWPFRLNREIAALEPDVVMIHSLMFPVQVILLRLQLGKKVKIVVQHHAEQAFRHPLKKWVQYLTDRCVQAYFFTSEGLATPWIQAGLVRKNKVREIMEVSSVFQQEDKIQARKATNMKGTSDYLWVGHLNANKNPLLVVQSFIRFISEAPVDARLYMIFQSDALLPDIKQLLAQYPVAEQHVHLVGKVPHAQLQSWFSAADFIISSSYYEGSGVAVCEGMSCGCIPVLTDIPSFRFMTGGNCGFLYEAGNENALLKALQQSYKTDRQSAEQATLRQYRDHLSFEAIAVKIQDVLSSL